VVDDGSTDDTLKTIEPFLGDLRYLKIPENRGVSAARNLGIENAKGEYILFLDSDDFWLPGKLVSQVEDLDKNPDLLFSQCQERWIRDGVRVNPKKRHLKRSGDIFIPSLELTLISPSALICRREFFETVGLFDPELPVCEDYDLFLRALSKYKVGLLDRELLIRYAGSSDQLSKTVAQDRYRIKSLEKLLASKTLNPRQTRETERVLEIKKKIYFSGLRKRL
jgi:glycosyltransferase involved in cell wall biosynthesis